MIFAIVALAAYSNAQMYVSIIDPRDSGKNGIKNSPTELNEIEDLCANVECEAGERCMISGNEALCECYEDCQMPNDARQKICSTSNQTFESDCHFLRQKCWCNKNERHCKDFAIVNDKLDYYGACRHIEVCSQDERRIFVERMKVWLDEVLHILDERDDLDSKFFNLVKQADQLKAKHVEKYWTAGVIFEFCELDTSKDHMIQKEEISQLISSIKSLEHCIQPFLDECDQNQDGAINDYEWGKALDLSSDDLALLRQYC